MTRTDIIRDVTAASRIVRVCEKPIGRITWKAPDGYTDSQMIRAGVNPDDLTARRFAGGLPDGWTAEVVTFKN